MHFLSLETVILVENIIMITKERLYKQIESLPDKLEIEDLIEKLLLIGKIDSRIEESDADKTLTAEELDKEIQTW